MRLPRNRQNLQRIDGHERIVVGRTGKSREVPLLLLWGRKDDISGIKARGAFAEMGGNDSGMQKQRPVREEVVRRKRDFSDDILPMGTCGAEQSARCNAEARNTGFCRAASAETGVAERVGMFRHRADRGWVYRVSPGNESGTDQKPDKGAAVMLNDFSGADKVYIACGYTDLRRGIDGLATIVQQEFSLDPFTNTLFLFCGRRRDRIKALYWEGNGFVLLYKRLESGSFQWPRSEAEAKQLTAQQYRWLMEGLSIEQPKAHKAVKELSHI